MQPLLKKLVETAGDATALAASLGQAGIQYAQGLLGGMPVVSSLFALAPRDGERDETHYLLIPVPDRARPYTVFTRKVIPEGVGITNSLPKARIFHVPAESGRALLERELISQALGETGASAPSEFADRLEALADEIDRETTRISGGLILIGGAVAFFNPLLGVGIAAQSLMPTVGGKASKAGIGYLSDQWRKWDRSTSRARLAREARREVERLKPEVFANPLLESLDALVTNPRETFDPFLADRNWIGEFPNHRYCEVTVDGIAQIYRRALEKGSGVPLSDTARRWIAHLIELSKTR